MKHRPLSLIPRLCTVVAVAALSSCGVPKVDYEALQKENQELQKVIDKGNASYRQLQLQLQAAQQGLAAINEVERRMKDLEAQLAEKEEELRLLQETYDKFKKDRRSAMLGKEFPSLRLDNGRTLQNAQITAFNDNILAIRHETGFLKVALSESSEALRWEACYDPVEEAAAERRRMIANAKSLSDKLDQDRLNGGTTKSSKKVPSTGSNAEIARQLRATITQQRAALNRAHAEMMSKNPSALRGAHWNSTRPEESGLINVFSERRAIIGISELDSLAASIKYNLAKLRSVE